ncbi:hypothetical protein [Burkholderia ubonensis]|uniref:hypothetical protein n=1 Tax=Burkholderia ubonensis TaxID=101571 RepID=UPI0015A585EC|nr:hypothetical protein [Burkholderia ubonensis]
MSKWLPGPHEIVREGIVVLCGTLIAAWVLSKFPTLRSFVLDNGKVSLVDSKGNSFIA